MKSMCLTLAGLFLLSMPLHCMEKKLSFSNLSDDEGGIKTYSPFAYLADKAEEQAAFDEASALFDNAIKPHSFNEKEDLIQRYLKLSIAIARLDLENVNGSSERQEQKHIYKQLKKFNNNNKKLTKEELLGAADYFSDEEELYSSELKPAQVCHHSRKANYYGKQNNAAELLDLEKQNNTLQEKQNELNAAIKKLKNRRREIIQDQSAVIQLTRSNKQVEEILLLKHNQAKSYLLKKQQELNKLKEVSINTLAKIRSDREEAVIKQAKESIIKGFNNQEETIKKDLKRTEVELKGLTTLLEKIDAAPASSSWLPSIW